MNKLTEQDITKLKSIGLSDKFIEEVATQFNYLLPEMWEKENGGLNNITNPAR